MGTDLRRDILLRANSLNLNDFRPLSPGLGLQGQPRKPKPITPPQPPSRPQAVARPLQAPSPPRLWLSRYLVAWLVDAFMIVCASALAWAANGDLTLEDLEQGWRVPAHLHRRLGSAEMLATLSLAALSYFLSFRVSVGKTLGRLLLL